MADAARHGAHAGSPRGEDDCAIRSFRPGKETSSTSKPSAHRDTQPGLFLMWTLRGEALESRMKLPSLAVPGPQRLGLRRNAMGIRNSRTRAREYVSQYARDCAYPEGGRRTVWSKCVNANFAITPLFVSASSLVPKNPSKPT